MEQQINFIQIEKDNAAHFEMASKLWIPFIKEVNEHDGTYESEEQITNGLKKRVSIQGRRKDMHFVACVNEEPFVIAMFTIDLGTVYGLLEKGYGTIMGFYIHPKFRRKGLGTSFSKHIEATLYSNGARKMYICPDSVTGEPFWKSNGYTDSGKIDPDDKKPIYIKEISCPIDFTNCKMIPLTQNAASEISQWNMKSLMMLITSRIIQMGIFRMNLHGEQNSFAWRITMRLLVKYLVSSMEKTCGLVGQWLRNFAVKAMVAIS